jgi:arylsulfatase A-like enzyme
MVVALAGTPHLGALGLTLLAPLLVRGLLRTVPALGRRAGAGPQISVKQAVVLGAAVGTLAGALDAATHTAWHLIERHIARGFSWEMLWLDPAAGALGFAAAALLLAIAFPGQGGRGVALVPVLLILAVLGGYAVLQNPRLGLHPLSAWLLAGGLGVVAARRAASRDEAPVARTIRRVAGVVLTLVTVAVAVGLWHLPVPREWRALATLPPARPGQPNVLLLVLDTVRAASLGLYGHPQPTTPQQERLAPPRTPHQWAIATAPWTLASHASMFTGLYPTASKAEARRPLAESHLTVAEVLAEQGYATAGFVANMAYTTRLSGLAQGFARYEDRPMTWGRLIASNWLSRQLGERVLPLEQAQWRAPGRKHAEAVVDEFLTWLDHRGEPERPFFGFLNFIDAHDPYVAPERLRARFPPHGERITVKRPGMTEDSLASTRAAYEAAIARVDEQLGRLSAELARRGLLERTVIIVVSDHGEQFGEHGLQFHGNSLYRPLIRVPLVLIDPRGVPAGRRVAVPVSIRDIARTLIHAATDTAEPAGFPGRSLLTVAAMPEPPATEPILSVCPEAYQGQPWEPSYEMALHSVIRFPYHLIRDANGRLELYRLDADAGERQNLAAGADPTLIQALTHDLDSLIATR